MYTMNYIITMKPYRYTVTPIIWHCKIILKHILRNDSALSKFFMWDEWVSRDIHNRPNINNCLSISCYMLILISSWNIKLFNCSPARVVVIGRPVHRITSIASSHLSYKIYTYVLYLKQLKLSISASRPA